MRSAAGKPASNPSSSCVTLGRSLSLSEPNLPVWLQGHCISEKRSGGDFWEEPPGSLLWPPPCRGAEGLSAAGPCAERGTAVETGARPGGATRSGEQEGPSGTRAAPHLVLRPLPWNEAAARDLVVPGPRLQPSLGTAPVGLPAVSWGRDPVPAWGQQAWVLVFLLSPEVAPGLVGGSRLLLRARPGCGAGRHHRPSGSSCASLAPGVPISLALHFLICRGSDTKHQFVQHRRTRGWPLGGHRAWHRGEVCQQPGWRQVGAGRDRALSLCQAPPHCASSVEPSPRHQQCRRSALSCAHFKEAETEARAEQLPRQEQEPVGAGI